MPSEPKTAQEWDKFLLNKYGYGIWDFTYSLVRLNEDRGYKYFYPPDTDFPISLKFDRAYWLRSLKKNAKKLQNLKFHIINALSEYCMDWGQIDEKDSIEIKEKFVTDLWDLGAFFERLDFESDGLSKSIKTPRPLEGKGPPVKVPYQVAFLWSKIMKDNKGRSQWEDIVKLLDWFGNNLRNCKYWDSFFGNTKISEDSLRREFWIVFKKSNKKKERCEFLEMQQSIYFPIEKDHRRFQIEFKNQFINIDHGKEHPLLIFPDGSQFPKEDLHGAVPH